MKATNFIIIIAFSIIMFSCGDPTRSQLDEIAKDTEKIELYVGNTALLHEMLRQGIAEGKPLVTFTNKDNIAGNLLKYISDEATPEYKCGSDGMFKFIAGGKVIFELEFKLSKDCRHFAFAADGKAQFRKITPEGLKYFSEMLKVDGM